MPYGAELSADGSVRFRLWAPPHADVRVELDGRTHLPMRCMGEGWHELTTDRARAGTLYRFVLKDALRVPDPASRYQPHDVHGPSEVVDAVAYDWKDAGWSGRPWHEAVLYELHVGTFTPEGTFRAAIGKLDHLRALGVTALEIMPVGDFPGRRNWGYDGVLPYAPDAAYGRPEDLKALIDAAHGRGLMVLLDVVYNHFGPEGAYLHATAPQTFTERHKTPWGAAINMDGPDAAPVRDFFIHNALYWIEEFHLDGLRLDAVHAILDDSPKHILEELTERARGAAAGRHLHLILENEENEARRLVRQPDGTPRLYTAQWNDDVHHVLHVAATGETTGYYGDYAGDTGKLGRALAEGFVFQGEVMPYRGHARGEASASLPPAAFVAFIQNHDQVGNRAFGDRLTAIASPEAVRAVAAVYLLLPQIPMLFMGEEWAAAQPFPFFCDFGPDLADAVRNGRREEFARFPEFQDPATRERIPDPLSEETFASARLNWDDVRREPHRDWLDWYARLLAVRHAAIVPRLPNIRSGGRYSVLGDGAVLVQWTLDEDGRALTLAANLSTARVDAPPARGRVLWREGSVVEDGVLGPFAVRWSIEPPVPPAQPEDALDRLAERMGICPQFQDARGTVVRASAETKRRLLGAMGLDASGDHAVLAALDRLERAEWLRPLPPVLVAAARSALAIDVTLPGDTAELTWQLTLEDGTRTSGHAVFGTLDLLARRIIDGCVLARRCLSLGGDLPLGYHRFTIEPGGGGMVLVVTPGACWLPAEQARTWGIAAQLYLLRSASDWGIGDFGDLCRLIALAAAEGAQVIGLNPLHGMFHDDPEQASPYSPASRLLLNVLNIDVSQLPELQCCPPAQALLASEEFRARLEACRAQRLVDYAAVTGLKLEIMELLFDTFRERKDAERQQAFADFRRDRGEAFERTCLFLALREHVVQTDPEQPDWHDWPQDYRDPTSTAVARFAETKRRRIDFLAWLQWVADEQLGHAASAAAQSGMSIGLYRDLAVGANRAGAETWADAAAVVSDAEVGAPPDIFNPAGQNWGLPPFHPRALRDQAYRSFVELLRANMRHAGGLRIDHVMGLQQLYWIPQGQNPADGAYVRYPLNDLLGILALESHRQRCIVVGEDLGTVPEGFRDRMAAANVLSYRVLFFEQDATTGAFLPPAAYPQPALAVIGSHDLPTLRGWWEGRDIALKQHLGLFPGPEDRERQSEARRRDKAQLVQALHGENLLQEAGEPPVAAVARAAHAFLARTPCLLAMVQIDDLTDEADPVNVPATSDEHPNWRRRLSMTLEELAAQPRFRDIAAIVRGERGGRKEMDVDQNV
jgi:malto-oligosyltrehalose trehalohydrolase/4-alpha-glucanotransferase